MIKSIFLVKLFIFYYKKKRIQMNESNQNIDVEKFKIFSKYFFLELKRKIFLIKFILK